MNSLSGIPVSYLFISIFLSGFALYSLIKFIYIYIKTERMEAVYLLLIGAYAFFYIAGETTAIIIFSLSSDYETSRVFIIIRELSSFFFLIAIPYIAGRLTALSQGLKKFNRFLFGLGITAAVLFLLLTLYNPVFLTGTVNADIYNNIRLILYPQDVRPLFILKKVLLISILVYTLLAILFSGLNRRVSYPAIKIYISFIVLSYFILTDFFNLFFFSGSFLYIGFYFPYISTGISLFLILNTFGLVDVLIDYANKLVKIEKELKQIVYEDKEIGIKNRNGFIDDLQMELFKDRSLSLIFIDIDDFQNVNESFGEKTGDEILKLLAKRLLEFFSQEGRLYRIGGEDFVFFFNEFRTDEEAGIFAGKIISSLRNPFIFNGVSHMITVSMGIIQVPRDGETVNTILNNAYSVIRNAKQIKNSYSVFSREMAELSSKRINTVNLLRTSISMDQFELFYQPVVDAAGNMVYAESLLRCTNPDPAIGGPGNFIPLMEKAGLIKEIDNMVIRKAFHDMEMIIKKRFSISINLSSNQLTDPSYSDFLFLFSSQHGIPPELISLEVTENTLIENLAAGRESILNLKDKGFKIAIDDFGKGFSSLSYLSELPVDVVKIDMAFVQNVPGEPRKESIVTHIINLAHSLGLKVVAEGFEKKDQFEFFKNLGCDNFQGYYFSRPIPLDEFLNKYTDNL